MKTFFKTKLALMAGAVIFSACTEILDDIQEYIELKPMNFTAVQEKLDETTKATIDSHDIKWSSGDKLSVFDRIGNREFLLEGEGGSTSGVFTGSASGASTYYALYPYTEGASLSKNKIAGAVLPATQTATAGSADPAAMLMMATSTDAGNLAFKNVCAYVKVTPNFDCSRIEFTSKGEENLAGTLTLDCSDGTPVAEVTANGTGSIALTGTISSGNTYYIAVLPSSLESGFVLRFLVDGDYYEKDMEQKLALTRNNVMCLGSFSTSDLKFVGFNSVSIYSTTISGDANQETGYGIAW